MLRRLPRPLLTIPATLAVTALAVCGGERAGASSDDTEPGDGEAVLLSPTDGAEVGQAVEQETTMTMTMSSGGEDLEIELRMMTEAEIVSVEPDGGYRSESMITDVEAIGDDAQAAMVAEQLDPIIGLTMTVDVAADGQPGEVQFAEDAPAEAEAMLSQFGPSFSGAPIAFPDEPVAVGDEWSDELDVSSGGLSMPMTMNFTLVALDDESYTLDVEYTGDLDQPGITGEISASGTITGSRTNPLLLDSDLESVSELEGDGMSISQRFDVVVESEPAGE